MNELATIYNEIETLPRVKVAGQIMQLCRAITPQFYKNQNKDAIRAELSSVEICIADIEQPVLSKMCELAVVNYATSRSKNERVYFDTNYIITFYKQAFNIINCENVVVSKKAEFLGGTYDYEREIVTEKYKEPDGSVVVIREIIGHIGKKRPDRAYERYYSSKFYETLPFEKGCQGHPQPDEEEASNG